MTIGTDKPTMTEKELREEVRRLRSGSSSCADAMLDPFKREGQG